MNAIKIDYYAASGISDSLSERYNMQDEIHALAQARRKSLSIYITGLVKLTTDLRKERRKIKRFNYVLWSLWQFATSQCPS